MSFKGADLKILARIDIRRGVGLLNIKLKFNRQNVRLHACTNLINRLVLSGSNFEQRRRLRAIRDLHVRFVK